MQAIAEPRTATPDDRIAEIIAHIANALRSHEWQAARPHRLTPTQARTLLLLAQREPSPVRVGDTARQLNVTAATASDTITTLVRKELITRESSSTDRRAVELRLTTAGREACTTATSAREFLTRSIAELPSPMQSDMLWALMQLSATLERKDNLAPARMCLTCSHFGETAGKRSHYCTYYERLLTNADLQVDCPGHSPDVQQ